MSASTHIEDEWIGVPSVRIDVMILNPSYDYNLNDDVTPLHNTALPRSTTNDDTIIARRKVVDHRHRRYKYIRDNRNIDEIHEQSSTPQFAPQRVALPI